MEELDILPRLSLNNPMRASSIDTHFDIGEVEIAVESYSAHATQRPKG